MLEKARSCLSYSLSKNEADEILKSESFVHVSRNYEWLFNFNNTSINPNSRIDNSGTIPIEQYIYDQGDNSVSVEHLKYIGGEHVWFDNTFQGYSTGELIWNFVSKYDINGKR